MVRVVDVTFFVFQKCGTTFRSYVLRVDDTVDGKYNLMEETVGVGVLLNVLLLFQVARASDKLY